MKKYIFLTAIAITALVSGCCNICTEKNCEPVISLKEAENYPTGGSKIILSLPFDGGKLPFALPKDYSIVPSAGVNGTSALKFARTSNKVGEYIALPLKGITPGQRYQLRAKIRGNIVNAPGSRQKKPVVCGIEYRINGKPREVLYPLKPIPANYEEFSYNFVARGNGMEPHLVLYLWHDWSGEVFFDDVEIRSEGPDISALLLSPQNLTFKNGEKNFSIHIDPRTPMPAAVIVTLEQNGKTFKQLLTCMDENFNFHGEFPQLKTGKGSVTIDVLDLNKKENIYTGKFNINVLDKNIKAPANASYFDQYGRLIVDGKPFMVLGIFGMSGEKDLKRISEAGFNCMQLYSSFSLQGKTKHADVARNIKEGMDLIHKHNLKLLFSTATQIPGHGAFQEWGGVKGVQNIALRGVTLVKDHPALLGYYISDECPRSLIPYLLDTREKISAIDPFHPVWTLTYRIEDLPLYNITGDVFGIDVYPIDKKAEKQSLDKLVEGIKASQRGGQPVWLVPQAFNWALYDVPRNVKKLEGTRGPNLDEMRAMPLLGAVMGCRGFVFFSYAALFWHGDRMIPGYGEKHWPDIVKTVQTMKSLEKFIMGKEDAGKVEIAGSDRVMAKAFKADDGEIAVVVVALGPDPVKVQLKLPVNKEFKSRFGLSKKVADGVYEFTAKAINADILE